MTDDHTNISETPPWWRHSHVAHAIAVRAVLVAGATSSVLLVFWIGRELLLEQSLSFSIVWRVLKDSLVGCATVGFLAGIVFGVPLGIVSVLSVRASLLDIEQDLADDRQAGDARHSQNLAEASGSVDSARTFPSNAEANNKP